MQALAEIDEDECPDDDKRRVHRVSDPIKLQIIIVKPLTHALNRVHCVGVQIRIMKCLLRHRQHVVHPF